jgi:hypothetical protein
MTEELRMSHVIPKFAYKQSGLIGDKKKFAVNCFTNPGLSEPHRQDGFKEPLLCDACEKRLNVWETYANEVLFCSTSPVNQRAGTHCILGGLDYSNLKLFTTSVLWRMGVSSHPFFCRVNLGAQHEEAMRQMLLNSDPREPWRYACVISVLTHCGTPFDAGFSQPKPFLVGKGRTCYRFVFSGMLWNMYVTSTPQGSLTTRVSLQPNGDWVLFTGEFTDHPDLAKERELLIKHRLG